MESAVPTSIEIGDLPLQHGRAKKRNNAIVAMLSGALPGAILTFYLPVNWERWLLGLIIGLVWGNAFEYAYHRWLLHRPRSSLGRGHLEHHAKVGTPEEPEHTSLGKSPLLEIIPRRDAMEKYNLHAAELNRVVNTALAGQEVGKLIEGNRRFDIVVRLSEHLREQVEELKRLPVRVDDGGLLTLGRWLRDRARAG